MKRSGKRNQKERVSGRKQQPYLEHNRSLTRSILSIVALTAVGLTSFIFIFPELITFLFPELSSSSILYFFYSLSDTSTNLWITLKNSPITVSVSLALCVIVLLTLLYRFSPYIITKDEHSFIKKKLFFRFYKITNVLQVSSVDNEIIGRGFSASKSHINFSQALVSHFNSFQMLVSKHESAVNIFFLISKRGLSKKKLLNKVQKEIVFLTNLLSTYYGCSSQLLSVEQTKSLYQTLNKKNYSNNIDFSSLNEIETDALEMFYSTLSNTEHTNLSLLLEVKQKERNSSNFMLEITSFSDNTNALNHFINATGLKRKSRVFPFNKPQFVSLEDLHKYTHLPVNYKGTKFPLGQKMQIIKKYEQSILLGTNQSTMSDEEILLGIEELLFNTEIYGMIGRGKTRLVCSIIDQLISFEVPCLIFDIKGEYASTFVDDPNVDIYTIGEPHPLAINIFETKDEDDVHSTLLLIEEMMLSSNQEFSPSMKNLFETALFLTHKAEERDLETFVEILQSLTKQKSHVPSVQLTMDAVLNRLNFIFNPINFGIIGVKETTLDFEALNQGSCVILDLSQFQRRGGRPSDIFLICNLILKLFYRFASNKELTNKLRYVVVLEEAINVIPNIYRTESSASLITSENNFLLGRSMGIGHITISQMWDSVSKVVHGNSSTKIFFRSGQAVEKIAKALDLQDEERKRLQKLPIRNCFVWIDGQEQLIEMTTVDFSREPMKRAQYLELLKNKYPLSSSSNHYDSFIDMRTSLFDKMSKTSKGGRKEGKEKKNGTIANPTPIAKKEKNTLENKRNKDRIHIVHNDRSKITKDDYCKTFCSTIMNKQECVNTKMISQLACSILIKEFSNYEIEQAILGTFTTTIEDLLKQILSSKKLDYSDRVLHCAQRELVNRLMSKDVS